MSRPLNPFSAGAEMSAIAFLAALADEARAAEEMDLAHTLVSQIYAELDARQVGACAGDSLIPA